MGVWHLLRRVQRGEALEQGGAWILVGEGWDPERMDLGALGGEVAREGPGTLGKEWFLLGSGGGEKEYQKVLLELAEEEDLEGEEADIDGSMQKNTARKPCLMTRITLTLDAWKTICQELFAIDPSARLRRENSRRNGGTNNVDLDVGTKFHTHKKRPPLARPGQMIRTFCIYFPTEIEFAFLI
jgi:hypothetical protein